MRRPKKRRRCTAAQVATITYAELRELNPVAARCMLLLDELIPSRPSSPACQKALKRRWWRPSRQGITRAEFPDSHLLQPVYENPEQVFAN